MNTAKLNPDGNTILNAIELAARGDASIPVRQRVEEAARCEGSLLDLLLLEVVIDDEQLDKTVKDANNIYSLALQECAGNVEYAMKCAVVAVTINILRFRGR